MMSQYRAFVEIDMKAETTCVESEIGLEEFISQVRKRYKEHGAVTYTYTKGRKRTRAQNDSLQKFCGDLAQKLNDAGFDMRHVFKADADIPWTKTTVREQLWGSIQKAYTGKKSTTEPTTKEYFEIYDILNAHLIKTLGISVPWPSSPEWEMHKRKA
jgi:hypothetical protein